MGKKNLDKLQGTLGVKFKKAALLEEALTHRSYLNEEPRWHVPHNERLEYLGDAVLELAVTEALFHKFPEYPEGQLTVLRAALVNYQSLARVAAEASLQDYVYMSRGEAKDNGKAREVILANAVEAVIGALYLDQGFEAARKFVQGFVMVNLDEILSTKSYKDPKSELQEIVQDKMRITPSYQVLSESGPAHVKTFRVGVFFGDERIAEGEGTSKQEAEVSAAREALKRYK